MNVFIPYPSFRLSVECLDYKRLGKQRIECKQTLLQLLRGMGGYKYHPINDMWRGYEKALALYGIYCCREWRKRGYLDNQLEFFKARYALIKGDVVMPHWWGDPRVHDSHKSNLYRKDSEYYKQFEYVGGELPYVWIA